jgi:hypothetical protein
MTSPGDGLIQSANVQANTMTPGRLRVAVATEVPLVRWQARCIEALALVPGVTIERWIQAVPGQRRGAGEGPGALGIVPIPDPIRDLVPDAEPRLSVLDGADGTADILLDLTGNGVARPDQWAAETWRFRYGERLSADPDRTALVDYVQRPGRTRVALVAEPGGGIVREGWLSWWRGEQLERMLLDPTEWPAMAALDRTNPPVGEDAPRSDDGDSGSIVAGVTRRFARVAGLPRPVLQAAALTRRTLRVAGTLTRHDDWHVGVIDAPISDVIASSGDIKVRWLPGHRGRFAADPFGIERDGVLHVFYEDFDQRTARGTISHLEIAADGTAGESEPVLDPGVHTSYPFLIEHGGRTFMMPETASARKLVLYEAIEFPRRWQPAATMLDGIPAVDASVVEFGGRWWMFATRIDRGANHNLFIWHAPELVGPWTPHVANPVKTDSRSARPGGTPFVADGKLYRPTQDDSLVYGGRVVVNEVMVLTPRAFVERPVGAVSPQRGSAYPDGLHTLSGAGTRTLIDGNIRHFVRETLMLDLAAKVRGRRPSRGT